ncbi:MAG: electron transport complex subunit RsxC [Candidatus Omnitrophota bacterium]
MVRLAENKIYTENHGIEKMPLPKQVCIPLSQHIGRITSPLVKVGDEVSLGQKIADSDAAVSSPAHASISGKITAIKNWPHPVQGMCQAIVIDVLSPPTIDPERSQRIDGDGKDKATGIIQRQPEEIEELTAGQLRQIVREAGVVGMGGAGFPTHIKLTPPKPVDTFILNGAECEPFLTGDYRLMIEKTEEILKGVDLVTRCLGIKNIYIAIEDNKPEAIAAFKSILDSRSSILERASSIEHRASIKLVILKSHYPQGGEKQLIKNVLKKEVPSGKLPFDVGVLVNNVGTIFAIYEAVYKSKPLYERVITVTGDCLENPKNLLVRIGTPVKELIEFCQPFKKEPVKIVFGGPMMGIAQYNQAVPIIKTSTAVLLLSSQQVQVYKEDACIRCGECVRNCPVSLMPCMLSLAVERNNWELAKSYSPLDCIECGLCAYLCPAKRNLVQSIKYAKQEAV